tara:strand:+ start:180 stop:344 length:165 start_codon:yes stop_codon:yes gene_type:complete
MLYDLERVINNYLEDEKKHKDELDESGEDTNDHIYHSLMFLKTWLIRNDIRGDK